MGTQKVQMHKSKFISQTAMQLNVSIKEIYT